MRTLVLMLAVITAVGCRPDRPDHPDRAADDNCVYRLRNLARAKTRWADNNNRDTNSIPTWTDLFGTNDLSLQERMTCPQSGATYTIGTVGEPPRCSVPMHSVHFGWVIVQDSSGGPLEGAEISVLGGVSSAVRPLTNARGVARVTPFPASVADEWCERATGISASRAGYHSVTSALPGPWPVKIQMKRDK